MTFQQKLLENGYCDSRGAGFCATVVRLPRGEYGLVSLCVKDHFLHIYKVDRKNNLGKQLYSIDLKKIENLRIRMNWSFSQVLKFDYEGALYAFTDFSDAEAVLQIMEQDANSISCLLNKSLL